MWIADSNPFRTLPYLKQASQVNEYMFVGGTGAIIPQERIRALQITLIIDCSNRVPKKSAELETVIGRAGAQVVFINVRDREDALIEPFFDEVADRIEQERIKGGRILVHCVAGVSRSVSLCMTYLMKYQAYSLRESFIAVASARPIVAPNVGFWKQMIEYEHSKLGRPQSVKIVRPRKRDLPDVYFDPKFDKVARQRPATTLCRAC